MAKGKRTYQPNNRHRAKVHGFRHRMRTQSRSLDPGGSTPQRTRTGHRLTCANEVAVRTLDVRRVFDEGRPVHGSRVVVFLAPGTGAAAYVAGRKVGNAVKRNRARRILASGVVGGRSEDRERTRRRPRGPRGHPGGQDAGPGGRDESAPSQRDHAPMSAVQRRPAHRRSPRPDDPDRVHQGVSRESLGLARWPMPVLSELQPVRGRGDQDTRRRPRSHRWLSGGSCAAIHSARAASITSTARMDPNRMTTSYARRPTRRRGCRAWSPTSSGRAS